MKQVISDAIDFVFDSMKYAVRNIMIFPGDNLKGVLKYAVILFLITLVATVLKLPTFNNCIGTGAAVVILAVIYLIGKGGNMK